MNEKEAIRLQNIIADNDLAALRGLIASGERMDDQEPGRETPLMLAAGRGRLEMTRALIPVSNPLAVNEKGLTALLRALDDGHSECAKLLSPVSDVNHFDNDGENALMVAVRQGEADCVAELLKRADAKLAGRHGFTPLMIAAMMNSFDGVHEECARLLLPVSDANARDDFGCTALMRAAQDSNWRALETLLPWSDPDARDTHGLTPLMYVARDGGRRAAELLATACDVNARASAEIEDVHLRDTQGMTAFEMALFLGQWSVAEALMDKTDEKATQDALRANAEKIIEKRNFAPKLFAKLESVALSADAFGVQGATQGDRAQGNGGKTSLARAGVRRPPKAL